MEIMEGQDSDWDTFWFIWMQTYIYYGVVSIECDFSSVSVVLWNFSCFSIFYTSLIATHATGLSSRIFS